MRPGLHTLILGVAAVIGGTWSASWLARLPTRTRRGLRKLLHGVTDTLDASRNARRAEAIYRELSRLSDAELERRGTNRRRINRLVFNRLTVGQDLAESPAVDTRAPVEHH
jgi:hypothetical protein